MDNHDIWEDCIGTQDLDFWGELERQEEIAGWEN